MPATDGAVLRGRRHLAATDGVVLYHGFGQNRHSWDVVIPRLQQAGWGWTAADARGHGASDWCPNGHYAIDQLAQDAATVARQAQHRPVAVGASMGGLLSLLAQQHSGQRLFRAIVLVDITTRWERGGVSRILQFMAAHPDGFDSIDQAAQAMQQHLSGPVRQQSENTSRLKKFLRRDGARWLWHWDPALLDNALEKGEATRQRLDQAARSLNVPILLISGGASDVVSQRSVDHFLQLAPHAQHVSIDKAGHRLVGDADQAFSHTLIEFLEHLAAARAA